MDSTGLYDTFRSDVVDTARPYLWTDDEVWRYATAAHNMFLRLTGGVVDFMSEACEATVTAGEPLVELHPSILRIMSATMRSDTRPIEIINPTDVSKMRTTDYGQVKQLIMDNTAGVVRYFVLGLQKGYARLVQVPTADDTIDLNIYRLPLKPVDGPDQEISDIEEDHHIYLLAWMKHLAYKKQDADTFNPKASEQGKQDFQAYCALIKAERARYMYKPGTVAYGGL